MNEHHNDKFSSVASDFCHCTNTMRWQKFCLWCSRHILSFFVGLCFIVFQWMEFCQWIPLRGKLSRMLSSSRAANPWLLGGGSHRRTPWTHNGVIPSTDQVIKIQIRSSIYELTLNSVLMGVMTSLSWLLRSSRVMTPPFRLMTSMMACATLPW